MTTVPVHTNLPVHVYARLYRAAEAHDTTVGALVAELVRRALTTASGPQEAPQPPKTRRAAAIATVPGCVRVTPGGHSRLTEAGEAVLRERHAQNHSDGQIAAALGVGQPTASAWRRRLGLDPNHAAPHRGTL